jgi:hypothetical protein
MVIQVDPIIKALDADISEYRIRDQLECYEEWVLNPDIQV